MKAQDLTLLLEGKLYSKANIGTYLKELEEASQDKLKPLRREVLLFLKEWFSDEAYMVLQTSGSTGKAKRIRASKEAMLRSAEETCKALKLQEGDTAILCISPQYIGGMMMIVRAMLQKMKLVLAPVQANPLSPQSLDLEQVSQAGSFFIALVPMQVQSILSEQASRSLFKQINKVIIGGASLKADLLKELKDFPNEIYSTYGMTETLSHIALKRLSGEQANRGYYPLEGVKLRLSEDGSLNIFAPYISEEWLETNDLAKLSEDGSFELLGRRDNVVNSGGVKLQIEKLEALISTMLPYPIALTSITDEKLGEALVLLIPKEQDHIPQKEETQALLSKLKSELPRYSAPKQIVYCKTIPQTPNGKIDRKACKALAQAFLK